MVTVEQGSPLLHINQVQAIGIAGLGIPVHAVTIQVGANTHATRSEVGPNTSLIGNLGSSLVAPAHLGLGNEELELTLGEEVDGSCHGRRVVDSAHVLVLPVNAP